MAAVSAYAVSAHAVATKSGTAGGAEGGESAGGRAAGAAAAPLTEPLGTAVPDRPGDAAGAGDADSRPARWQVVPDATPRPDHAVWMDVAALGPADAWAVGLGRSFDIYSGIAAHWDGRAWTRVQVPGQGEGHEVTSVSAVGPADVWAVGRQWHGASWRWNGTAWQTVAVPGQPDPDQGSHTTRFDDVAAVSARDVWAVGVRRNELVDRLLVRPEVIHWNGRAWSRVTPPRVGPQSRLTALAPVSASNIWAVGYSTDPETGVRKALLARWDGASWRVVKAPELPADAMLHGVTALSRNNVWAVGTAAGRPLALRWDGSGWHAVPTPAIDGALTDVAPDGRGGLWATGGASADPFRSGNTFFLRWNGYRWTSVADPANATGGLYGLGRVPGTRMVWAVGGNEFVFGETGTGRIELNRPGR